MRHTLCILILLAACEGPPTGLPTGAACDRGADCVTGVCVGFGCGTPGTCVDPTVERECGPDAVHPGFVPACTCAGEELPAVRPLCPPDPIAFTGHCEGVPVLDAGPPDASPPDAAVCGLTWGACCANDHPDGRCNPDAICNINGICEPMCFPYCTDAG